MPQVGLFVFSNIKKRSGFANIFSKRKQNSDNEFKSMMHMNEIFFLKKKKQRERRSHIGQ
jgi:hypothetical protein